MRGRANRPPIRQRRRATALLLMAAAMLVSAACAHTKNDTRSATQGLPDLLSNLTANAWLLDRPDSHPPLDTRAPITLEFSRTHTFHGSAACHTYHGEFSLDGRSLTIRTLDSDAHDCTGRMAAADNTYFLTLRVMHDVAPTDQDHLRLGGHGGWRLIFNADRPGV